jgi:hypothetical protein
MNHILLVVRKREFNWESSMFNVIKRIMRRRNHFPILLPKFDKCHVRMERKGMTVNGHHPLLAKRFAVTPSHLYDHHCHARPSGISG